MAMQAKRRASNVVGDFYVDTSCIDCGTCRWVAPESFDVSGSKSRVYYQPENDAQNHRACMALLACPVGAIGSHKTHNFKAAQTAFPDLIEANVFHCGYHSRKSYGATSYLIQRKEGNLLVDSPRFIPSLISQLEALGGIRYFFLSHIDDVADHSMFARHFGCDRILHQDDVNIETDEVEIQPQGETPLALDNDLLLIPTPGHTKGSCCLLYQERYLFTGDHLWWNPGSHCLSASPYYCWYSWEHQIASMELLAKYRFSWVLPGHGQRIQLSEKKMKDALQQCIDWMKRRKMQRVV
ncbi:MAG: beta-lactamase [Gammaproteobacteria bacterium (ex Lamellibrachia satsuma)]|nr:MAG: MBL fold metallo-hydrolase [Gammaproteobacteria bacterium (ex Lamellibrachia satsuma)]RRS35993.1 MAG: beta-lactamase [Gammaproteobacteria bacterium (ex Lamellibrachia satsuma)]RRS36585.1 MAG: beta-lactamase [Gammaproteobacteria bacterium (ex Lamellibrachia satsuma)]